MKVLIIGGGRISLSHLPHILAYMGRSNVHVVEKNWLSRWILKHLFKIKVSRNLTKVDTRSFTHAMILTPPRSHFEVFDSLPQPFFMFFWFQNV